VQLERPPQRAPAPRPFVFGETSASENSFVRARCGKPEMRAVRARRVVLNRNVHISHRSVATRVSGALRPTAVLHFAHRDPQEVHAVAGQREAHELLLIEEADAWFEYLEATRGQTAPRYKEVEPWAWARLSQRLRAIKTRRAKLRPAAAA
jgi:hypothetical protein